MRKFSKAAIAICACFCLCVSLIGCDSGNPSHSRRSDSYTSVDRSSSSSSSYSGSTVYSFELPISNVQVSSNSVSTYAEGSITNRSNATVKFVEVRGSFMNSYGNTVDTDWTYAVGSEGLKPGESTKFKLYVTKDSTISRCNVAVQDFKY